jgi:hypothetical protein
MNIEHWIIGSLLFVIYTECYLTACKLDKDKNKPKQWVLNLFTALIALPLKIIVNIIFGLLFALIGPFVGIYTLIKK